MLRTFLAIDLPDGMHKVLVACQDTLKKDLPSLKWVQPQAMHLTLKFLGDIHEDQVDLLRQVTEKAFARWPCFSVKIQGLGLFPNLRHPRVLWVGVTDDAGRVADVAELTDSCLQTIGVPREAKAYTPHLTLARIKEYGREVGSSLTKQGHLAAPWIMGLLPVRHICLFQSERRSSGSVYTKLWDIPLAPSKHENSL
ncbi:MAG: RNA 2',3'-cyclic phosphodiesterase [Nitrospirales bacterium]|nr:RNA 2',3'-cyclic phosphodiesterase [Nitrospirales bacterium]